MRGMQWIWASVLMMGAAAHAGPPSIWTNTSSGATETIVGVSAAGDDFAVGVGNNGQIVHITGSLPGSIVPSGTNKNLFDVYVAAPDFAVASGQDVVLLWNGATWSPLFPENTGPPLFYTPVWASRNKDFLIYQQLSSGGLGGFNTVCPYVVADPGSSGFCRLFSRPVLTICGDTGADLKVLQTSGTILRFSGNSLANLDDPLDRPLFEQPVASSLNLIAAFIPPELCQPGNDAPPVIYAINQGFNNEFYQFDGTQWTKTGDAGMNETLTGIAGLSDNLVVAVGRRPSSTKGPVANEGVAWAYDGNTWINEALPPGTPGLADLVAVNDFQIEIFADGFEAITGARKILPPEDVIRAWGEASNGSSRPRRDPVTNELIPQSDLGVDKKLLSPDPPGVIGPNDTLVFRIEVTNFSSATVDSAKVHDSYLASQLSLTSVSCMSSTNTDANHEFMHSVTLITVPPIPPLGTQTCDLTFTVISGDSPISTGFFIENRAFLTSNIADINTENNVDTCTIRSGGATVDC